MVHSVLYYEHLYRQFYKDIVLYLSGWRFLDKSTKAQKAAIGRRSKNFVWKEEILYYQEAKGGRVILRTEVKIFYLLLERNLCRHQKLY